MKKILVLLLTACFLISFSSCKKKERNPEVNVTNNSIAADNKSESASIQTKDIEIGKILANSLNKNPSQIVPLLEEYFSIITTDTVIINNDLEDVAQSADFLGMEGFYDPQLASASGWFKYNLPSDAELILCSAKESDISLACLGLIVSEGKICLTYGLYRNFALDETFFFDFVGFREIGETIMQPEINKVITKPNNGKSLLFNRNVYFFEHGVLQSYTYSGIGYDNGTAVRLQDYSSVYGFLLCRNDIYFENRSYGESNITVENFETTVKLEKRIDWYNNGLVDLFLKDASNVDFSGTYEYIGSNYTNFNAWERQYTKFDVYRIKDLNKKTHYLFVPIYTIAPSPCIYELVDYESELVLLWSYDNY